MWPRSRVVIALAIGLSFAAGLAVGASGLVGVRVPMSVGDGIVGDRVATIWADGTAYGARDSIAWRDEQGADHDSGWPTCLSTPGEVTGVHFGGAVVWSDGSGIATILWVDCSAG